MSDGDVSSGAAANLTAGPAGGSGAAAGCAEFDLIPQSPDQDQAVAGTAAVRRLLAR